jgi:MoaA/NifB/PqqE/SkfB family radical SAM enzyme
MRDWSKAEWVDPSLNWKPLPFPELPERLLIDFATKCNLRCPMCPVWGSDDGPLIEQVLGVMDLAAARKILDEVTTTKPMIAPSIYGEPLLIPNMREVFADLKARGLPIAVNTNGLTLNAEIAKFWVAIKVDSIMFSLDATTRQTLRKVRGIDKLEKIESAVFRLMKARGDGEYPRIGVSFTVQQDNKHELEDFVGRWVGVVDVVRIGLMFDSQAGTYHDMHTPIERKPCPAIYNTMPIHNDGTVRLCCLDGFRATDMGNIFEDGLKAVWEGQEFAKARYYHETGQWDKVPFCKNCNGWAQHDYQEEIRDGLLIRRSPQFAYYNKIDRLRNWTGTLLGGHQPPPSNLTDRSYNSR